MAIKKLSFKKGEKSLIDKKPIADGQLLVGVEGTDSDGRNLATLYIDSTNPDSGNVERFVIGSSSLLQRVANLESVIEDLSNKVLIGYEKQIVFTILDDIPYEFHDGCAVVYNNEIHILGSYDMFRTTRHYKWNGTSWTSVSTLPYKFYYGAAVVYNDEIHIFGGGTNTVSDYYTKHYKWDGTEWSEVSTLPYNFCEGNAVVYNGEIHLLGGWNNDNSHYKFDGTSWTEVSTIPKIRIFGANGDAVVYNNEIHIFSVSGSDERYHYKWDGAKWSEVSTLPYLFYDGSVVVYDGGIHLLGSYESGYTTKHYRWDGISWKEVSTLPYSFYRGDAVVYNNEIHLLGGYKRGSYDNDSHCSINIG